MSRPYDPWASTRALHGGVTPAWPFPVGVQISQDGTVRCAGRIFWSEAAMQRAGKWASMVLPRHGDMTVALTDANGNEFQADLIDDAEFRDSDVGRAFASEHRRQQEAEIASIVRRQAEALVDLVDQRIEDAFIASRVGLVAKALKNIAGFFKGAGKAAPKQGHHRNREMALRRYLALQKAAAIFEHPHAVLGGHLQLSSSDNFDNRNANPVGPGSASSK